VDALDDDELFGARDGVEEAAEVWEGSVFDVDGDALFEDGLGVAFFAAEGCVGLFEVGDLEGVSCGLAVEEALELELVVGDALVEGAAVVFVLGGEELGLSAREEVEGVLVARRRRRLFRRWRTRRARSRGRGRARS
jgi:hypothetical protein